ncbi:NERD domain-containing protein [Nocardia cyriacigeorgica]|uniref:NERD domain-containing protein n=2 Tax=Nocardia cyriacigeorgica TaxID=135487 RepID=UPI00189507A7|nr:NERD domain-containing protein [Nocardia cyriacigeorgica]MBF6455528.1 NERD domain-containing protein [Nocardia cyriacigeorgica]MBF6553730.1 NERD domain-containing protein [Nocardia cyriacigeorgica]
MGYEVHRQRQVCTRRWTAVNESAYPHERSALDRIRAAVPDADPWRAWSNFSFATAAGELYEIDLLIAAPSGLHLVELKSWRGRLAAGGRGWVQTNESDVQIAHGHPLRLLFHKCTALERLLSAAGANVAIRPSLCVSNDRLRVELPGRDRRHVLTADSLLTRLARPTHNARHRMTSERVDGIERALSSVGISSPDQMPSADWATMNLFTGLNGNA